MRYYLCILLGSLSVVHSGFLPASTASNNVEYCVKVRGLPSRDGIALCISMHLFGDLHSRNSEVVRFIQVYLEISFLIIS